MKKKLLFLIMTLLAFVASSPHANAWNSITEFDRITGWDIARPEKPTENLAWKSMSLNNGSVDFVALNNVAYISIITATDDKAVGNYNEQVQVNGTSSSFDKGQQTYVEGNDPDFTNGSCKLNLTGMTAGATYTLTLGISDWKPQVTSFKLKYPVLYLRGTHSNWDATDEYKFTQSNGIYTLTLRNEISANSQWKIGAADWGNKFYRDEGVTLENITNGAINRIDDGYNEYNLYVTTPLPAGTVFTYNISTQKLNIFAPYATDAQPVTLTAAQRMEGSNYSFDLELTPKLDATALARKFNNKSGSSMATSVVITPADDDTKKAVMATSTYTGTGWTKNADGSFTHTFDANNLPTLTICDIAPNKGLADANANKEYKFNVELTSTDTDWQYLKYTKAEASASIEAPTVGIILDQPTIVKVAPTMDREDIAKLYANVDTKALLPAGSHATYDRIENPALYTLFNEVQATATIDPLKVANLSNWTITYDLTVNGGEPIQLSGTPTDITIHGLPADLTKASATVAVTYTRGEESYTTAVATSETHNFTPSFAEPDFTVTNKTWFQRNSGEPNNASPENNRTLAFAQFDGRVGGINLTADKQQQLDLNYYIGYNFTADAVTASCEKLAELKSKGTTGDATGHYWNQQIYWGDINGRAANGGRVIGKRVGNPTATSGTFVGALDFDYLYYPYIDGTKTISELNAQYINDWTVANNSWSEAFKKSGNDYRLPIEVGPIDAVEIGQPITIPDAITGTIDIVYPILEGLAVTDETAEVQQRAAIAKAPKLYTPATIDLAKVKTITRSKQMSITFTGASEVTGIEEIAADALDIDADAEAEIYNLQGIRVNNPAPGNVYIVRRGSTVSKILYK